MVQHGPSPWLVWFLIVTLGLGTYGFRLSFIQLQHWFDELPPQLEEGLAFIPPAILAALIFPELVPLQVTVVGMFINSRAIAGFVAFVVAWRTGNMMATIGVGMVTLWTIEFLVW